MNAKKNLLAVPLFWFAIFLPIIVASFIAGYMGSTAGLHWANWTKDNLDFTFTFFKIPLLIVSLIFPLAAVVIANHRSVQSVAMMKLQDSQNNFANYWLHLDKFKEQLSDDLIEYRFPPARITHDIFYPKSNEGDLEIDRRFIDGVNPELKRLNATAKKIYELTPEQVYSDQRERKNTVRDKERLNNYNEKKYELVSDSEYQQLIIRFTHDVSSLSSQIKSQIKLKDNTEPSLRNYLLFLTSYCSCIDKIIAFSGVEHIDFGVLYFQYFGNLKINGNLVELDKEVSTFINEKDDLISQIEGQGITE